MAQLVKNPPVVRATWVRSLGWEDPLEKGTAIHSGIPAWNSVHGVAKSQTRLGDFHLDMLMSLGLPFVGEEAQGLL